MSMKISRKAVTIGLCPYTIVISQIINNPSLGFAWSARIVAFISLPILIFCNLVLKSRLPRRLPGPLIDLKYFKDPAFSFFSFGFFFILLGISVSPSRGTNLGRNVHSVVVYPGICCTGRYSESQRILAVGDHQCRVITWKSVTWVLRR